jgi:hypothetical protein
MENQSAITLHCITKDGKRERTKLAQKSLADARDLAQWVLHAGNGFYTEVTICTEEGIIETIQNSGTPSPVGAS